MSNMRMEHNVYRSALSVIKMELGMRGYALTYAQHGSMLYIRGHRVQDKASLDIRIRPKTDELADSSWWFLMDHAVQNPYEHGWRGRFWVLMQVQPLEGGHYSGRHYFVLPASHLDTYLTGCFYEPHLLAGHPATMQDYSQPIVLPHMFVEPWRDRWDLFD